MKKYPKYRSPVRLLNELGLNASEINLETLKSERTRFLEILRVSSNKQVRIGRKSCTESEVIEFFDELDSVTNIDFHHRIFEHPALLRLLEDYDIAGSNENDFKMRFDSTEERYRFTEFVSPFLAFAIDQVMIRVIATSNYNGLSVTIPFFRMLTEKDGVYAFKRFNEYCENLDQTFDAASLDHSIFPINDFLFLRYYPFYDIVNEVEFFHPGIVDKVAISVSNFTLMHQKNPERKDHISAISTHLKRLKCSDDIVEIIKRNDRLYESQALRTFSPKRSKGIKITLLVLACLGVMGGYLYRYGFPDLIGNELADEEEISEDEKIKIRPVIDYVSDVDRHRFDLNAFKLFHDSTFIRVRSMDFTKNDFVWDGTPEIRTPMVIHDSMGGRPVGRIVKFMNETPSEMIMIVRDRKSLNSYYTPPNSAIRVALDPKSHVFFYSGNQWNDNRSITYLHPYSNYNTDYVTLRYTGSFDKTIGSDLRLLKNMYYLKFGSTHDLKIQEINGEYVFSDTKANIPTIKL